MKMLKQILSSKIFANFSTYLGFTFAARMFPFFLIPILTKYLTPAEYGTVALYQALLTFITPLVGMGLENNITRAYFNKSKQELAEITSHLILIVLIGTSVVLAGIMVLEFTIPSLINLPVRWAASLPILAFFNTLNVFNLVILRNEQNVKVFGFYELFRLAVEFLSAIALVVFLLRGAEGRFESILITAVLIGILSYFHMKKNDYIVFKYDKALFKYLFILSLPYIPHAIGGIVTNISDKFFLILYWGQEEL